MMATTRSAAAAVILALCLAWGGSYAANGPMFRTDDPLKQDPDTIADASGVAEQELSQFYDFLHLTFQRPGERRDIHAVNVNTIDEVPASMWFVDRIGRGGLTEEQAVRGPDEFASLDARDWVLVGAKNSGLQPGFRVVVAGDASRQMYQVEFDPPDYPELATGAEIIGTALYHALGYHVVENYLVTIDPARVTIDPKATIRDAAGRNRPFTRSDLNDVLRRAARRQDGTYRGLASRFAPGEPRGAFRYYGTRPDDPNDIYPHEHRRELRGARVFGAWVNHDDSRANNTLDMLEGKPGARYLRHYMFDFGSIMGSATTGPNTARSGNEYLIERRASLRTLYTFGLVPPAWATRGTGSFAPAAGPFSAEGFDPIRWRPEYPNPAFENMQPADAFWGARRVAAFTDAQIRGIVDKARYSDPAATEQIVRALIERRDLIARTWLTAVTPVVDPVLSPTGGLRFTNVAVDAGVVDAPVQYELQWSAVDNASRTHTSMGEVQRTTEPSGNAPAALLNGHDYIAVTVRATAPGFPHWTPVECYFRRESGGWKHVGLVRQQTGADDDE